MEQIDEREMARYRLHAELCKVLTDPKRLMILDILRHGDRSVTGLADAIGVALPNASQHLAVMRNAGLVESRRAGTTIIYRLAEPTIVDACDIVHRIVERRLALRPALRIVRSSAVQAVAEDAKARLQRAIATLREPI